MIKPPSDPALAAEDTLWKAAPHRGDSAAFPQSAEKLGGGLALDLLARALQAPAEPLVQTLNAQVS
jgi:hypothetical protein